MTRHPTHPEGKVIYAQHIQVNDLLIPKGGAPIPLESLAADLDGRRVVLKAKDINVSFVYDWGVEVEIIPGYRREFGTPTRFERREVL